MKKLNQKEITHFLDNLSIEDSRNLLEMKEKHDDEFIHWAENNPYAGPDDQWDNDINFVKKVINHIYDKHSMGEPIILKFDSSNDFTKSNERLDWATNVRWILRNALSSIDSVYDKNAPRRIEMEHLVKSLNQQLISQLSDEDVRYLKLNEIF